MSTPKARLARRVHFSSGHRYFSDKLSEEENKKIFGACYSPYGHGHNYILEAYFEGPIDPVTGMVINLGEVDRILKEITTPLDHHHLNYDIPYFKEIVPTCENIALYLYKEIEKKIEKQKIKLFKVRLFESEDLWADVGIEPGMEL